MDLLFVTFPKHLSFGFWIQKFFSRLPSELLDTGSYPQIMNMIFNPLSVAYNTITPFCPKKGPSHFFVRHVDYWPQIHSAHRVPKFQGQNPKFPATSISLNVNYRAARHRDRFLGDPLGLVFCRGPSGMERNNGTAAIRLQHIIPWCYTNGFVNTWEGPIVIPGSMPVPVRSEQSADSKVDSCCIGRETWHTRQLKKKHLNHEMFFDRGVFAIGQLVYLPLLLLLDDYGWCWMDYSVHCQDPCGQTKPSLAQGFLRPVVRMPPLGNPRGRVSSLPELKVQKDQNIQLFQEPRSDSLNMLQSASKKGRHHSLMTYV